MPPCLYALCQSAAVGQWWDTTYRECLFSREEGDTMATFEKRTAHDGTITYRVKVRRKGCPLQTATFAKLTDAKRWAQITEGAVLEGRYFHNTQAKHHTVGEMIDRYLVHVLPQKRPN